MTSPFLEKRSLFPTLSETIHLSSCSQSAISLPVKESIQSYLTSWTEKGMDWEGWMDKVYEAKVAFATLINASPDEIAVLSSVSDAASSFAASLDFTGSRNKVVTTDIDFPCIGHVWLSQVPRGANVTFLNENLHQIQIEQYEKAVNPNTLITSVPHVSYYNGFIQDIKAISNITKTNGSLLFVDAYQSAGSVQIDVKEMGVDALATGAQKFLLGIPGISFLYVRKELAESLYPPTTGWFSRVNPFAFDQHLLDYAEGTRRFDTGTPMMINAYAAEAGISLLNQIGVPAIQDYLSYLSTVAIETAHSLGLTVVSPTDLSIKGSNTAIRVQQANVVEQYLKTKKIIVSARNDVLRVAPHFYNTEDEVVRAIEEIAYAIRKS
ncbi:aminotransferase class V-fold PLP-dependent enzyme [Bacillus sp. AFS088145]|uniref:aminotransferase class V-fold PLP-dependent enzyme n=1 Tax=Bacillus sp. AFS088145 TaxID=2033514 RepID=UPI000BF7A088|nr:aminotransferase class V-fold PLP-dependent enzyme [Bacillus sp. AFS088145]PFH91910.1 aminotransferase [Bacillus sp. AFS088145]